MRGMSWNQRLKQAREAMRPPMSKAAFARAMRVSAPTVTEWENGGITTIKGENLMRACQVLGVTESWLMNGRGAKPEPSSPASMANALDMRANTADEQRLLTVYRLSDEAGKHAVNILIENLIAMLPSSAGDNSQAG